MRQKRLALICALWILGLANTKCVSVNIGSGGPGHRASEVKYREPSTPFMKEPRDDVDGAWKNPANGNLISYFSDCGDSADPGLDTIVQSTLSGLSELHVESNQTLTFLNREARRVKATGRVDGVPSAIDFMTFKRNRCMFILSYVGVLKNFDIDHNQFERFLEGFHAQ